ncbi:redox-sensing transcriptional repressor Rex [Salinispira pacifica]|nr:redox-sensing transcriptional repressor Rex [Salinispira pacifica]
MPDKLSKGMILRMVRYLRVLRKLKTLGIVNVFSNNLGDALGVTPAVVRKDFSQINITGNKRGGYNIDVLMQKLEDQLGKRDSKRVIVAGCGRIGQALMAYREFPKEGINIIAGFDNSEAKIDREAHIPILPMEEMEEFVKKNEIEVAIISVPEPAANDVFDQMLQAGIRGVLNFTPVELKCQGKCDRPNCPKNCTVHTVNIGLELENLFYLINMNEMEQVQDDA